MSDTHTPARPLTGAGTRPRGHLHGCPRVCVARVCAQAGACGRARASSSFSLSLFKIWRARARSWKIHLRWLVDLTFVRQCAYTGGMTTDTPPLILSLAVYGHDWTYRTHTTRPALKGDLRDLYAAGEGDVVCVAGDVWRQRTERGWCRMSEAEVAAWMPVWEARVARTRAHYAERGIVAVTDYTTV